MSNIHKKFVIPKKRNCLNQEVRTILQEIKLSKHPSTTQYNFLILT